MSKSLDEFYIEANKALKHLSLVVLPVDHNILLNDLLTVILVIERYYFLEAANLFLNEAHKKQFIMKEISPFRYTIKVYKQIKKTKLIYKTISQVLNQFSIRVPSPKQIKALNLPENILEQQVDETWLSADIQHDLAILLQNKMKGK